jgi:hypothetical protein
MVLVFDNEDLAAPFRKVAEFQHGKSVFVAAPVPQWLRALHLLSHLPMHTANLGIPQK